MKIVKSSKDLSTSETYKMTMDAGIQKMREAVGSRLDIAAYCKYEDENKDGDTQTILSVMTDDGEVFATNSPTFIREFDRMVDLFKASGEDLRAIKVITGTSKAGREFITLTLAD